MFIRFSLEGDFRLLRRKGLDSWAAIFGRLPGINGKFKLESD
jgi:hypothetical protein